ncbi:MAG: sigma-54-dependent Fis family transcriptional regulator [Sphingomonadaceae bacterium]|nr:sigma-54-dependent Fis family transcriptional regulator [Sphingomonadaceae bacterium]
MQGAHLLLVEDDAAIATVIRLAVTGDGARIDVAANLAARDQLLSENIYDVLLTDVVLPDGNGLVGLSGLRDAAGKSVPTIILSAQNTLDTAIRAEAEGAFEYLPKPFDIDALSSTINDALRRGVTQSHSHDAFESSAASHGSIIGRADAMQAAYRTLARVAPTDLSVLILGESGTGKELVARAIHDASPRCDAPFVAVNMAAIPRELVESELFGHEKGAFTGAVARAVGRFAQADGGTLFLDEIGDMPLEAQTRLLRVLQSGEFTPVGGRTAQNTNIRIIAATNQDLPALIADGQFREDLYYRLNVIPICLPPLRERLSDLGALANHFLQMGAKNGLPHKNIGKDAVAALSRYEWPGNVRELSNVMQRLALLTRADHIGADDVADLFATIPAPDAILSNGHDPHTALVDAVTRWLASPTALVAEREGRLHGALTDIVEQELIRHALDKTGGNQIRAAALLGINRNTLRLKRRHGEGASP